MLTLVLLSLYMVTCSAAPNDVAAQPRNIGRDPQFKRVCYYTNWSQYRKQPARFFPFNIDPFLCTHLIFAFAKVDYKGQLAPYEWNDIQYPHLYKQFTGLKKKNPHLKTLLAVGGWTHGSRPFTDMVKTKVGRSSFIDQSIQYLRAHNFDGLDLDWEYPANRGSPEDDKKKFSLLVQEMRAAYEQEAERTGKERLLVTAAVGGGEKIVRSAYEVPIINKYLDFINLMSYDLHGSWSKVLGINAPLYTSTSPDPKAKTTSVDEVVQLWLELGASPEKLIMGIPTYGRSFTMCSEKQMAIGDKNCGPGTPAPYTRERGFVSYYEMSENLKQGWTRVWLEDQMVPFAYNLRTKQWVGYDDVQSVKLKAQYIKHRELGGAMVWAVDLDDFADLAGRGEVYPLCKAVRDVLEDADYPVFTPPPKLAPTEKKTKSHVKQPKKALYKQNDDDQVDRTSKFSNMITVKKSPYLPPQKLTRNPKISTAASSPYVPRRPTTVGKMRATTIRHAKTRPTSPSRTRPTRPTPPSRTRPITSSKTKPTKSSWTRPTKPTKPLLRKPSVLHPTESATASPSSSTVVEKRDMVSSTLPTRRVTSRRLPLRRPVSKKQLQKTTSALSSPTQKTMSSPVTKRQTDVTTPFYMRSFIPTFAPSTRRSISPSLPPVLSSSPKYPQWEPVAKATKPVPTETIELKKSSKDLKRTDTSTKSMSRKLDRKPESKKPVAVDKFAPKPTPQRSPYTPPAHIRKRTKPPQKKTLRKTTTEEEIVTPTYISNPRFPPKKKNNDFQASRKNIMTSPPSTKTDSVPDLSTQRTVKPTREYTTLKSVRRLSRPHGVNVLQKPETYDGDTDDGEFRAAVKSETTTPFNLDSSSTKLPTFKPQYSFKYWSKPTTVYTGPSTVSTIKTTMITKGPDADSISPTVVTKLTTRRRGKYSFQPWSKTTVPSTTPTTTTVTQPTTASTTPTTTTSTTTTTTTETTTTTTSTTLTTTTSTTSTTTTTTTPTTTSTAPTSISTTSVTTTRSTTRRAPYSFRPWSRTTTRLTTLPTTTLQVTDTTLADTTSPDFKAATVPPMENLKAAPVRPTAQKMTTSPRKVLLTTHGSTTPGETASPTVRITRRYRAKYSFKPWSRTTKEQLTTLPLTTIGTTSKVPVNPETVKEAVFKPESMMKVSEAPRIATTALPEFRPWTKKPKSTNQPTVPSSTKAFFLFAKLTASTESTPTTTSPTTLSTTPTTTSSKTESTSTRISPRARTTSHPKRQSSVTATNVVTIVKDKTFPVRKTTSTSTSTTSTGTTPTHATMKTSVGSTPDLRASVDGKSSHTRLTANVKTVVTSVPTTIKISNVDLKKSEIEQESEYRRNENQTVHTTEAKSTLTTKTPEVSSGPQKIFAWMTPPTTMSTTVTSTQSTPKTTTTTPKTTIPTTSHTATTSTSKPTTTQTTTKSTTTTPATTIATTFPSSTHSIMEASLGLDHTHPSVKLSPLRKGLRRGYPSSKYGVRFTHKPLLKLTPPPMATLPARTEKPYRLDTLQPDCDHDKDDVRQPDAEVHKPSKITRMENGYVARRKDYKPTPRPQGGYIIEHYNNDFNQRVAESEAYDVETRLTTWPKTLLQPNVRYNLPAQQAQDVGYNIHREPQANKLQLDYKLPGNKLNRIEQSIDFKTEERGTRYEVEEQDTRYEVEEQDTRHEVEDNSNTVQKSAFQCPSVFGIFPDGSDCRKFYQCVWFVPFHHMCGKGTVWNDSMKICDWPQSVTSCLT